LWVLLLSQSERLVAAIALAILFPLLVLTAITITVLSKRGALVSHLRVGLYGKALPVLKFRTMWPSDGTGGNPFTIERLCKTASVPVSKSSNDERVSSRFAAFCRRHSIDELPQLFHVVRGEMSFVGPRPITRVELETHYEGCIDEVLSVPPGMTGLWQTMGRNLLTYDRRRRLDLLFVRRRSPGLYLHILLRSLPCIVKGNGI
jgi:lipopolysaccharide/colanic/teichoic acid biosynthesis glycosyltransferase